jgi:hypothetical protein
LAEAWIAIREGEHQRALDTLEPLRHVSFDLHQHQMVDACLALTHYRVGHWQCAAALALDLFDLAVRTDNLRAQGGALEVSAYLAMRAARPETSARMLGKATDIRERSRAPLFSFWLAPHDDATYTLRALLGAATFDALLAAGALARDENAVEEARAMLRQLLTDQAPTSSPA